jgi:hypothetical protein
MWPTPAKKKCCWRAYALQTSPENADCVSPISYRIYAVAGVAWPFACGSMVRTYFLCAKIGGP